jgi:predicted tellurium resistance membrane protein TerC
MEWLSNPDTWQGLDFKIPKGYIYFSMAFAVAVELINIRIGSRKKDVKSS